jgi:parallel beta-helix repeat protein
MGRAVDLYSQKGGYGFNQSGGVFHLQEEVELYALVTYNEWPEQQELVLFEIYGSDGNRMTILSNFTDSNGITQVRFRIPIHVSDPTLSQGYWKVIAYVEIGGVLVKDYMSFLAAGIIVPNYEINITTIQEAINLVSDGWIIYVRNGTYLGPIVVNKTLTLMGESSNGGPPLTIIDGGSNEPSGSIVLVTADNVKISGFTIQHCRGGGNAVWLDSIANMTFSYNIITGCNEGIRIFNSSGNVVSYNIVQNCYYNAGVGIDYGINNTVYRNTIIHNHYGISGGIDCHGNIFSENTIINNDIGFGTTSYDSKFYHNNFVNNSIHVIASGVNQFDDGYPSGGNYWSDYSEVDLYHGSYQNETGNDGIVDIPYMIDENNTDRYPMMRPWSPLPGDINNDGLVGLSDLVLLAKAYGSGPEDMNWNPYADFDHDFVIGLTDLVMLANHYGQHYP